MTIQPFPDTQCRLLDDGRRLHLQHGPIDLVIEAFGSESAVVAAYAAAEERFQTVLGELVAELARLRTAVSDGDPKLRGKIAERMQRAVGQFSTEFITPMAAVAGAVADEILSVIRSASCLEKAYVNNGGDIALYLGPGEAFRVGLLPRADARRADIGLDGQTTLHAEDGVGGIATSGAGGRSFSLGIADAVTVLAADAAIADAAATLIANAVDVASPVIERCPATELEPDSDLGRRLVTTNVGRLPDRLVNTALENGRRAAALMLLDGTISAACLALQGRYRLHGGPAFRASRMGKSLVEMASL